MFRCARSRNSCRPEVLADKPLPLPELSEPDIVRHFVNLSTLNMSVDTHFYPLGSCTMKYNPKRNERIAGMPGFANLHPYQSDDTIQGMLELLYQSQQMLAEIAGLPAVSLQPAAGAQGELTALLVAAAYFRDRGIPKSVVLIPDGAHGTNPASAAMAGFDTVPVKSTDDGLIDLDDLRARLDDRVAVLMITNPNTLGIFETHIAEIARMVHAVGGLVYLDGANMNAILGITRPGDFGADLMHFNPHKTFSGPHGGGGPGAGPIAVAEKLAPYLPVARSSSGRPAATRWTTIAPNRSAACGASSATSACWCGCIATFAPTVPDGLRKISENAVLNANYLLSRVKHILPVPQGDRCMHEFVASAARIKAERDIVGHGHRQAVVGLRLPRPHGLLPADRQGGDHDRADRDREQGHLGRLRGNAGVHPPRDARAIARRPQQHARQPARRGPGGAAARS